MPLAWCYWWPAKKKKQMLELSCFTLYISVYSVHLSCRCVSFVYVTEVCSSLSEQFWWTTRVLHFRVLNNCNIRCITNCASFGQILFPNTFCTNFLIPRSSIRIFFRSRVTYLQLYTYVLINVESIYILCTIYLFDNFF